ncbi:hypothetical protein [Isoptericola variabilis]|uniref:Uncharacterized protein n=1 Tax=Isoptericola variabilis (strain 225) TaxID=743718 RepID=F6FUL8_ISOV2|nr:hypothetical protein [Isoptericola variabilis]AEG45445.1 hypothetical protein Isova_2749 [Isoptericola variabilis 225]TWH31533.1 hypothetical protein L600_002300000250 [Isoptericola variabilis J7]
MRSVRWSSVGTVVGATVIALLMLVLVVRGRVWAWIPLAIAAGVAVREVRFLQRSGRASEVGFDERRRGRAE